jgi:hypothetical protein
MNLETLAAARRTWTETLDRARELGVEWRGSRFDSYLAIIDELCQLEERRKTDPEAFVEFHREIGRQELLFEGASQMIQLRLASKVWGRLERAVLSAKLKKIVGGPLMPVRGADQGEVTDEPRDTLVELLAAAIMAEHGFEPGLTRVDEDLRLVLAGRPLIIAECKRPMGRETLPTALGSLRTQFWRRKNQGATLCMPFVAAERIEPFASLLTQAESAEELDLEVQRRIRAVIDEIRNICATVPGRSLGTLSPVGVVTFSGAVWVRQPRAHVHYFAVREPFDTGRQEDTPDWLVRQFRHSEGLLAEFAS